MIEVDGADFGMAAAPLVLKLELLQHAGIVQGPRRLYESVDAKNSACRVVAASVEIIAAVAFAAMKLKGARQNIRPEHRLAGSSSITDYGAQNGGSGASAMPMRSAASGWVAASERCPSARDDAWPGHRRFEFDEQAPITTLLVAVGGGGLIAGLVVCRPNQNHRG